MRYRVTILVHEGHGQESREDAPETALLTREYGVSAGDPKTALAAVLDRSPTEGGEDA